jgi:FAD/FMN-containing dehydrogenase
MKLTNWGNYPLVDVDFVQFRTLDEAKSKVSGSSSLIPRGLGRCYGDSALGNTVISTLRFDRLVSFDDTSGELVCQSGVSLETLLAIFVPRGWFLPTTPGTKFVTVGGAIASNVHGKNHHLSGSFSRHVKWLDLMLASGEVVRCSASENSELFAATCGGMGLTGLILQACITLVPVETAFIRQELIKARNLNEIMEIFEESSDWTYSVAWIDCLTQGEQMGRSIMMRGEHAVPDELRKPSHRRAPLVLPRKPRLSVPFNFPSFALNKYSVALFNFLYYQKTRQMKQEGIVDYDQFFYPLDGVLHWNRIYGKRGFTQYQFVLPKEAGREGLADILGKIASSGQGSFLAVLKLFGAQEPHGPLDFPREGYTLALDFPIRNGLFPLLDDLDRRVLEYGGRLYLAKDVRMSSDVLGKGYPELDAFMQVRRQYDPDGKFSSLQSQRTGV